MAFKNLFSLFYADDTIVLAENDIRMHFALSVTTTYCTENNLKVNSSNS